MMRTSRRRPRDCADWKSAAIAFQLAPGRGHEVDIQGVGDVDQIEQDVGQLVGHGVGQRRLSCDLGCLGGGHPLKQLAEFANFAGQRQQQRLRVMELAPLTIRHELSHLILQRVEVTHDHSLTDTIRTRPDGRALPDATRTTCPHPHDFSCCLGSRLSVRYSARSLAASTGSVAEVLTRQALYEFGRRTSPAEVRSWERSIPVLSADLIDAGLADVEVLLEHQLPLTSKRADVVLAGQHPRTGRDSYVVIELKQWTSAHRWEDDDNLVMVDGMPGGPKLHPARQVHGYCEYLTDFTQSLADEPDLVVGRGLSSQRHRRDSRPRSVPVADGPRKSAVHRCGSGQVPGVSAQSTGRRQPGAAAADRLLASAVAPSRPLLAVAADEVRDREQFVLQDGQQLAVDLVKHQVDRARRSDHKSVIVVTGGPGSGKSVVALSLLGDLAREGRTVLHATGSRSFTQTLRKVAGNRAPRVQKMFKYFNSFMTADRNSLDVLILDEAHRIRETSVNRYTKAEFRTDRTQLDELIAAARVPVFLLDENQVVRPGEQGSVESIRAAADDLGLDCHVVALDEQYRCGGSLAYVEWVERLLGLTPGGPIPWPGDQNFQLEVVDSPDELEARVRSRSAEGYTARMTAGYCWRWSDARKDGTLVPDVQIGDWAMPWNSKSDRRIGDTPPAPLWAFETGGIDQVGCVYTAQGFEYDWNGVILGPDLVWRDGRLTSDRSANRDPDFRNTKAVSDADFDLLVRNVYKVLLTRGMVGTVLYSTDPATRAALHQLVDHRP